MFLEDAIMATGKNSVLVNGRVYYLYKVVLGVDDIGDVQLILVPETSKYRYLQAQMQSWKRAKTLYQVLFNGRIYYVQ